MIDENNQQVRELYLRREASLARSISGQKRHELLFEPYNVSPSEYRVLVFLLYNPTGAEPSVIADGLHILRQTMTKIIDSLENKQLVLRSMHPSDRRRVFVSLKPEGETLARELLALETDYNDRVAAHFTPDELDIYRTLFARMQDARDQELQLILAARNA